MTFSQILKYIPYIIILIMVIVLFRNCGKTERVVDISPIKKEIIQDKKTKDSIHEKVIYKDSIRTKLVHHWHTIRHDSLIPCETKLVKADTIIYIDSSEISSLKSEILIDNLIIKNQDSLTNHQAKQIVKLERSVKRQKLKTKLVAVLGLVGIGVVLLK